MGLMNDWRSSGRIIPINPIRPIKCSQADQKLRHRNTEASHIRPREASIA